MLDTLYINLHLCTTTNNNDIININCICSTIFSIECINNTTIHYLSIIIIIMLPALVRADNSGGC